MSPRRIGLLGGAFDPPHAGHLRLACLALQYLALDELRFVPTARSPHKPSPAEEAATRLRMLEAALEGLPGPIRIEPLELQRGGTSYTVETLEALVDREPDCAWIWILGTDQLERFGTWHRGARILELASLGVALRPGFDRRVPELLQGTQRQAWSGAPGELVWLPSTDLDLASSALREGLSADLDPEGIPIQVRAVIDREKLYR